MIVERQSLLLAWVLDITLLGGLLSVMLVSFIDTFYQYNFLLIFFFVFLFYLFTFMLCMKGVIEKVATGSDILLEGHDAN